MRQEDRKATWRKWHWSQALRHWSNFDIWKWVEGDKLEENEEQSIFPFQAPGQEYKQVTVNCKYTLITDDCWWNACMAVHTWRMHYTWLPYMRSRSVHNDRKPRQCTLAWSSYMTALHESKFSGNVDRKKEKAKMCSNKLHSTNN